MRPEWLLVWSAAVAVVLVLVVVVWLLSTRIVVFGAVASARPLPEEPVLRPEPWRDTHPSAVGLPVSLVFKLVDPGEYTGAVAHRFRVDPLVESIGSEGLREPVVVHMDQTGKTVLADGNHRLAAHIEQGWDTIPVLFRTVRLIRGNGAPVKVLVDGLLEDK